MLILSSHRTQGFTLVETLVAVAILMIAISGPLTIASQALNSARSARNTMMATYLAQDGVESLRNIKDNNIAQIAQGKSVVWTDNMGSDTCIDETTSCATPDVISYMQGSTVIPQSCGVVDNCILHKKDGVFSLYNTSLESDGTRTLFRRSYFIAINGPDELKLTVVVSWADGTIPNEIRLQAIMTNTER
jgi:prepilin-type N-terminal cleavage/methylation domain-containing protein